MARQGDVDAEFERLYELCAQEERPQKNICDRYWTYEDEQQAIFDNAQDIKRELKKHWPIKQIFRDTFLRLQSSPIVYGHPLVVGRIMDIDPSKNLEWQMAELLFMDPKAFIDKWPTDKIWDEVLYPTLYSFEFGVRDLSQPQDLQGAFSLDWSGDRTGVDIIFTPFDW